jgi:hypothetical protein
LFSQAVTYKDTSLGLQVFGVQLLQLACKAMSFRAKTRKTIFKIVIAIPCGHMKLYDVLLTLSRKKNCQQFIIDICLRIKRISKRCFVIICLCEFHMHYLSNRFECILTSHCYSVVSPFRNTLTLAN